MVIEERNASILINKAGDTAGPPLPGTTIPFLNTARKQNHELLYLQNEVRVSTFFFS